MNEVVVEKPTPEQLDEMGVFDWPIWEKEISAFPWTYDATELCYLLEGKVRVKPQGGKAVYFGAGDLVSFPEGMTCLWEVLSPVKKHYVFV